MAQQPQERPTTRYVERVEVAETFADQVENASVADGCVKITLSATRWPNRESPEFALIGERITASRLVMPVKTAIEMYNSLAKIMNQLEQHGLVGKRQTAAKNE